MAACYDLGYMYEREIHVPEDGAKSRELFALAAEQGMPEAHRALENAFLHGRAGAAKDASKAVTHFKAAVAAGFLLGRGVARDVP